jgi:hypothetical protein
MKVDAALAEMGSPAPDSAGRWPGFVFKAVRATWLLDQWGEFFTELPSGSLTHAGRQIHVGFELAGSGSRIMVSFEDNELAVNDTALLPAGPIRDHVEDLVRTLTPLARESAAKARQA